MRQMQVKAIGNLWSMSHYKIRNYQKERKRVGFSRKKTVPISQQSNQMAIKLLLLPKTTAYPLQHPPAGDTAECREVESMSPNHMRYENTINTWVVLIS